MLFFHFYQSFIPVFLAEKNVLKLLLCIIVFFSFSAHQQQRHNDVLQIMPFTIQLFQSVIVSLHAFHLAEK